MSFIGLITAGIALLMKGKPHKNGCSTIITINKYWGGISLGCISLCNETDNDSLYQSIRRHEFGHSIQNIILGPFFIFIVAIPSVIRYWYYTLKSNKGYKFPSDWYYKIWFENTASKIGNKVIEWIEN